MRKASHFHGSDVDVVDDDVLMLMLTLVPHLQDVRGEGGAELALVPKTMKFQDLP